MGHNETIIIEAEAVSRVYQTGEGRVAALRQASFAIAAGEMAAITGRSGSGKSTLLNLVTGIDRPTSGRVRVAGADPAALPERDLALWRGRNVGIVFQFFQLLPTLTIVENVMLPMDFCDRWPRSERESRAMALLDTVGIADQARKFPSSLSGGQQQRAAIARALANDPPLLVADEPTGNLDSRNAEAIFELFGELAERGKTIVVVTHETAYREAFDRILHLEDGRIAQLEAPGAARTLQSSGR